MCTFNYGVAVPEAQYFKMAAFKRHWFDSNEWIQERKAGLQGTEMATDARTGPVQKLKGQLPIEANHSHTA